MTARRLLPGLLAAVFLSGCASAPPRFADAPAITRIDDTADMPEPAEHEFYRLSHHLDNFGPRQMRLRLDPVPAGPARDVNRLGDVPSSSWWEDRGVLSPERIAQGPGGDDPGPEAFRPWKITGMKSGGRNPGFVIEDARGVRYICKLDKAGTPVVATAAGAVAARLFWGLGYHAPDDRIVFVAPDEIVISDDAKDTSPTGEKVPLRWETVQAMLDRYAARDAAGRYRLLTSRFLPGRPVGGWSYRGTRNDDPNDTIPHQDRRSLRALRVFGAWLNHVDLKVDNSLDLYTEENGRRFLRHYLVDFDGCLGGYKAARHEPRIGFAYDVDLKEVVTGLPTFGFLVRPYEDLPRGKSPLVGGFGSEGYDPAKWKANYLNDILFACRPADAYWAGRRMTRLGPEHVRAAVTAARYGDPAADAILAQVLMERWEKTVDWALRQVTPVESLDRIAPEAGGFRVDATDALVDAHRPSDLRYRIEVRDEDGKIVKESTDPGAPGIDVPASAAEGRGYLVVRWTAETGDGGALPRTDAHYLRAADGDWKLVGVLRDGE